MGMEINCNKETWGIIPRKYFEKCDIATLLCMNSDKEKHIPVKLPNFYKEVVTSWHLCGGGHKAHWMQMTLEKKLYGVISSFKSEVKLCVISAGKKVT